MGRRTVAADWHDGEDAATPPPYRRKLRECLRNRRWIADNIEALMADYHDRWIVVLEQSLAGVGDSPEAALGACECPVDEVEAIVLLVPREIHRPI